MVVRLEGAVPQKYAPGSVDFNKGNTGKDEGSSAEGVDDCPK